MPIRILIADDHESVIRMVRTLLEVNPDWMVCGEAVDGQEAVVKALELRPDVVVLDLAMPRMNGLSAAHEISKSLPTIPIILYTLYKSPQVDSEAQNHGIRKVVEKTDQSTLVSAIQEVVNARASGTDAIAQVTGVPLAALAGATSATTVPALSAVEASATETTPADATSAPRNVIKAD
jgi:DNA-binding NarL/FixJ family response regulator